MYTYLLKMVYNVTKQVEHSYLFVELKKMIGDNTMKKTLALILCLIMVAAIAVSAISADETKLIDGRELEQYGQIHYYLGAPVEEAKKPNVADGKVTEGEYLVSRWFDTTVPTDAKATASETNGYNETQGATIHISYDENKLYLAAEVVDTNYFGDKDYVMFQVGGRDGGRTVDAVSRLNFTVRGDASEGMLSGANAKSGFGEFDKNDDGSWKAKSGKGFDDFVATEDKSISYDKNTNILTCEVAINLEAFLEFWGNDQELENLRLYIFLVLNCYGDSSEGANDGPKYQGYIWHYMDSGLDPNLKMNFVLDYPESSYFMEFFPHIIHFCEEPEPTTPAPTTTAAPTTPAPTTKPVIAPKATTTANVTDEATTNAPAATTAENAKKGCGATVALSALALLPMLGAAVVLEKKKDN